MNKRQIAAHNMMQNQKRAVLEQVIQDLVHASLEDSWKGGGDPADVPLIEAELILAQLKLERALRGLFPVYEMPA